MIQRPGLPSAPFPASLQRTSARPGATRPTSQPQPSPPSRRHQPHPVQCRAACLHHHSLCVRLQTEKAHYCTVTLPAAPNTVGRLRCAQLSDVYIPPKYRVIGRAPAARHPIDEARLSLHHDCAEAVLRAASGRIRAHQDASGRTPTVIQSNTSNTSWH